MKFPNRRPVAGFTLIELLVVILIISILLTLGAVGMKNIGGKGVTSAVATAEAVFDEARAIAVGKGTKARVLVDVSDPNDNQNYKRRMFVAYQELDEQGQAKENWIVASRAISLPDKTFFSSTYSKKDHTTGSQLEELQMNFDKNIFNGTFAYYEFNSEGISTTPKASFVVGTGIRPTGQEPRATADGKRDFGGFLVWRNGRTSMFRGPDEIGIPSQVTTF